jgi:hypothetical protein
MISLTLSNSAISLVHRRERNDVQLRVVLVENELYRLEAPFRQIRVVSGTAYVSHNGRDNVMGKGQTQNFNTHVDFALVSASGNKPLIVEILKPTNKEVLAI